MRREARSVKFTPHALRRTVIALRRLRLTLAEVLYGMALHDQMRAPARRRGSLEHLFVLISFGDLLGLPILPPYYSLRLLPYVVPQIATWKRRVLREKEFTDEHDYHLHGL